MYQGFIGFICVASLWGGCRGFMWEASTQLGSASQLGKASMSAALKRLCAECFSFGRSSLPPPPNNLTSLFSRHPIWKTCPSTPSKCRQSPHLGKHPCQHAQTRRNSYRCLLPVAAPASPDECSLSLVSYQTAIKPQTLNP